MPKFSEESLAKIEVLKTKYPEGRQKSALLPVLHMAQAEFGGWLSVETMDYVASLLNLQPIEVYEVATFYTMFFLQPTGAYVLEICQTGPCCLSGSERIVAYLEKKLNVKVGETTADGLFTLKTVECLASCGSAPMMQVGKKYYEHLTEEVLDVLLEELKQTALLKKNGQLS